MSSKKEVRRKRRERKQKQEQQGRSARNSALLFALGIGVAILLTLGGFALFGDRAGPGEPPRPGMVWSPAHDHWH
jgi:hypothetical protein